MSRLRNFLILLRTQFWLVPALVGAAALAAAFFVLANGATLAPAGEGFWWLYSGDAGSARELLSSLLSGLMTMTSLVISITFVILTLAASQLGPRLIPTFIADRQIQAVLGLFLGTILYILVVLRSVNDALGEDAVPHLAVTVASALTVLCLFTLLFYLHKVARSIIADNVVETVSGELQSTIASILDEAPEPAVPLALPPDLAAAAPLAVGRRGYIQTIDYGHFVRLAHRHGLVIAVDVRAGHFLLAKGTHLRVLPPERLDDEIAESIRRAFVIGRQRTPAQDLEYGIRQLVEIALRALSPGINDPFTAIAVIDRLAAAMEILLARPPQAGMLFDAEGELRVVADRSDIDGLMRAAFEQIQQAGSAHPAILARLADALGDLAPALATTAARQAALAQLDRLAQMAKLGSLAPLDREALAQRAAASRAAIEASSAHQPDTMPEVQ